MLDGLDSNSTLRTFVADLVQFDSRRTAGIAVLTVLAALTESIGLLLLIPLLEVVGAIDSDATSSIAQSFRTVLDAVGVPFELWSVLIVFAVLVVLRAVLVYSQRNASARLRLDFVDHLRIRLFEAVARANWRFHLEHRASDVSHAISDDLRRVSAGTVLVFDAFGRIVLSATYVAVAFRLSATIAALATTLTTLIGAFVVPWVRRTRAVGVEQTTRGQRSFGHQSELLAGMKLAKSHGDEARHLDAYVSETAKARTAELDFHRTRARTAAIYQVGAVASLAVLVWLAVEVLEIPSAELLVLIAVISRIAPMGSALLEIFQGAVNMLPAYGSAQRILHEATAAEETRIQTGGDTDTPVAFDDRIRLSNVSISYATGPPALDSVSIDIPARRTTALVGPSGAGKTTMVDVVLGLLEPDEGLATVDGVAIGEIGLTRWRSCVAYVPQDPFLFHDTLRSNLTWGATSTLRPQDLDEAIDGAALRGVVSRLPDGLETIVGDRGHRLSGGELQRVALVRALLRRPRLLVLDEATSALDRENEVAVQHAVRQLHGDTTIVVIAHRLRTIRFADQIVVLDKGQVAEVGTWDELIDRGGGLTALASESAGVARAQN